MWRPLRIACHAAIVFASCSARSAVHAAEMFAIQLDAGSPIATSLSDEGAMITHSLQGRYACHSLMGPKCILTNGDSDSLIPAAALSEMLRQVLASTVKARANSPSDASAPAAASSAASSNTGSNSQQQPASSSSSSSADLDESARTRRAAAAARPVASTSGVPYADDLDPDESSVSLAFEGGEVLYDHELEPHEIAELFHGRAQMQGGQPISEKGAEVIKKLLERAAAAADKADATGTNKDAASSAGGGGAANTAAGGDVRSASGGSLGGMRSLLSSLFDSGASEELDDEDGYEVEIDGRVHVLSGAEFRQFMAEHPWMEVQHEEEDEEEDSRERRQGRGGRGRQP